MLTLTRTRLWQSRLDALLSERLHQPFAWGVHDCALFAADAVLAVTEVDPAAALRGSYSTEAEARLIIDAAGGLASIATEALGEPVAAAMARPGDIGLLEAGLGETLVVCVGQRWMAPADDGLKVLRLGHVAQAWRVGE